MTDAPPHPDLTAIRAFLDRYFATWSARDLDGYAACFEPEAKVLFLASDGSIAAMDLKPFLLSQRTAHAQAPAPMTETPLQITVQGDAEVVQATVTWVLHTGTKQEHGTDYFTLRKSGRGWKIVALVFRGAS